MSENLVKKLIDNWSPRKELADEIGADVAAVHKWAASGRIPSGWQGRVVRAAQRKGLPHVTADWMLDTHENSDVGESAA